MRVCGIPDDRTSPDHPLGAALDTSHAGGYAGRFLEEVRGVRRVDGPAFARRRDWNSARHVVAEPKRHANVEQA